MFGDSGEAVGGGFSGEGYKCIPEEGWVSGRKRLDRQLVHRSSGGAGSAGKLR